MSRLAMMQRHPQSDAASIRFSLPPQLELVPMVGMWGVLGSVVWMARNEQGAESRWSQRKSGFLNTTRALR